MRFHPPETDQSRGWSASSRGVAAWPVATALRAASAALLVVGCGSTIPEESAQGEAGSCAEAMTAETLQGRDFAFDGTVLTVVPAGEVDEDAGHLPSYPVAEFEVHEWFQGGSGDSVAVKMQREAVAGERLLVSGEPLYGGEPLDDPIAWECGFTVRHNDATAETWRTVW